MAKTDASSLESRLEEFFAIQAARDTEPDPFQILSITRTESPYTHFLGWVLNPEAAHPWRDEFLKALLEKAKQPHPPLGPIKFYIESFRFRKEPGDELGFTSPDIVAVSPDEIRPAWCLLIENKFDTKEGRFRSKASQCASYQKRARAEFGDISYAFLFTTKTGEKALGETDFAAVSYREIAETVRTCREELIRKERHARENRSYADQFADYLLHSFLRHIDLTIPDDEVRRALKQLTRGERPTAIKQSWIDARPEILAKAAKLEETIDRWDLETMVSQIRSQGARDSEVEAIEAIFNWGVEVGDCIFQASKTSSFVIRIPTCGEHVNILSIQGRKLRFYWGHFIGGYSHGPPTGQSSKFPHAYALATQYCDELNKEFGWELTVVKEKDGQFNGFSEPSRPLQDVADETALTRFLEILNQIARLALVPSAGYTTQESNP